MALKGASPEHAGEERPDRWALDERLEQVARRWGIEPERGPAAVQSPPARGLALPRRGLLGADPLAADRQVLDAHRRGDVQPHPVAEELVDPLRVGAGQLLDVGDQPRRSRPAPGRGSPRRRRRRRTGAGASDSRGLIPAARRRRCPSPSARRRRASAIAGSNSAAARVNASATSSKPRSTAARNSSRLLANRLNTYGCATPTRRAIRSTGVPCRPPWANSWTAASISASRRSDAGTR